MCRAHHIASTELYGATSLRNIQGLYRAPYSDFLDLEGPPPKPKNPKNCPKLASDSSGTLKIGFSVKFYIYI